LIHFESVLVVEDRVEGVDHGDDGDGRGSDFVLEAGAVTVPAVD
jgi:hypothetical protein